MKITKIITIITLLLLVGTVVFLCVKIEWTSKDTEPQANVNLEYNNIVAEEEVDADADTEEEIDIEEKEELDETADWETYENEKFGYEIKYPSNWIITHTDSGAMFRLPGEERPMALIFLLETDSYTDSADSVEDSEPIKTFLADRVAGMQNYRELDSIVPIFSDSGSLGYKVTYNGSVTDIHFELKGGIIESQTSKVTTIARCVRLAGDSEYLDKIASTFKFTEPDETADWEMYENEEYNFSVRLPERWSEYKVTTRVTTREDTGYDDVIYYYFELPVKEHFIWEEGDYKKTCSIGVFPHERWNKLKQEDGPKPTYLTENNQHVFTYACGHDDGGFMGFPEPVIGEIYEGPFYEFINYIIPTFTLTD